MKKSTAEEVRRISRSFGEDAATIGAGDKLDALAGATDAALMALPFPEELSFSRDAVKQKAIDVGMEALDIVLRGGDPSRRVQKAAEDEASGRVSSLARRYGEWWDEYSPRLHEAAARMQDALFGAMVRISSAQVAMEEAR